MHAVSSVVFQFEGTTEGLTSCSISGKTERIMSRWKVNTSTVFILTSLIFIMLLIVVLPDVDLPDTAFHRGTAPVVVHTQATSAPVAIAFAVAFQWSDTTKNHPPFYQPGSLIITPEPNSRSILLRSIRC